MLQVANLMTFAQTQATINEYVRLNKEEKRLLEYKDSREMLIMKLKQVEHINKSRRKHNVQEVKLDIFASRIANLMTAESAHNGYLGHFNLEGEPPYLVFANHGNTDHVTENVSGISYSGTFTNDGTHYDIDIDASMRKMHDQFMAEKAPNDGHKQTCINKYHNRVGIGVSVVGSEFRYHEEYLDHYLEFEDFNPTATRGRGYSLRFKPTSEKWEPYFIIVHYLPKPQKMSAAKINKNTEYTDYTETITLSLAPWELPKPDERGYTTLSFTPSKKGYYYIHIYLTNQPITEDNATTKDKLQASGIVIKVE